MAPHRIHPELGIVKRCSGEDTLGVAPRENSSMPGLLFHPKPLPHNLEGVLFFTIESR
jgi:hypothetical protein